MPFAILIDRIEKDVECDGITRRGCSAVLSVIRQDSREQSYGIKYRAAVNKSENGFTLEIFSQKWAVVTQGVKRFPG